MKWKQSVCFTILYSSTFYNLVLPFFVLKIFKLKYDTFFVRHSAFISKFESSELLSLLAEFGCEDNGGEEGGWVNPLEKESSWQKFFLQIMLNEILKICEKWNLLKS